MSIEGREKTYQQLQPVRAAAAQGHEHRQALPAIGIVVYKRGLVMSETSHVTHIHMHAVTRVSQPLNHSRAHDPAHGVGQRRHDAAQQEEGAAADAETAGGGVRQAAVEGGLFLRVCTCLS